MRGIIRQANGLGEDSMRLPLAKPGKEAFEQHKLSLLRELYGLAADQSPDYDFDENVASPYKVQLLLLLRAYKDLSHRFGVTREGFRVFITRLREHGNYLAQNKHYYDQLKHWMETAYAHLLRLSGVVEQRAEVIKHLGDLTRQSAVCAPGVFAAFGDAVLQLEQGKCEAASLEACRQNTIKEIYKAHIATGTVLPGNETHVLIKLKKIAHESGFSLADGAEMAALNDQFLVGANIDDDLAFRYQGAMFFMYRRQMVKNIEIHYRLQLMRFQKTTPAADQVADGSKYAERMAVLQAILKPFSDHCLIADYDDVVEAVDISQGLDQPVYLKDAFMQNFARMVDEYMVRSGRIIANSMQSLSRFIHDFQDQVLTVRGLSDELCDVLRVEVSRLMELNALPFIIHDEQFNIDVAPTLYHAVRGEAAFYIMNEMLRSIGSTESPDRRAMGAMLELVNKYSAEVPECNETRGKASCQLIEQEKIRYAAYQAYCEKQRVKLEKKQQDSSVAIQRVARGWSARRELAKVKLEREQFAPASVIQNASRSWRARRELADRKMQQLALRLQGSLVSMKQRFNYDSIEDSREHSAFLIAFGQDTADTANRRELFSGLKDFGSVTSLYEACANVLDPVDLRYVSYLKSDSGDLYLLGSGEYDASLHGYTVDRFDSRGDAYASVVAKGVRVGDINTQYLLRCLSLRILLEQHQDSLLQHWQPKNVTRHNLNQLIRVSDAFTSAADVNDAIRCMSDLMPHLPGGRVDSDSLKIIQAWARVATDDLVMPWARVLEYAKTPMGRRFLTQFLQLQPALMHEGNIAAFGGLEAFNDDLFDMLRCLDVRAWRFVDAEVPSALTSRSVDMVKVLLQQPVDKRWVCVEKIKRWLGRGDDVETVQSTILGAAIKAPVRAPVQAHTQTAGAQAYQPRVFGDQSFAGLRAVCLKDASTVLSACYANSGYIEQLAAWQSRLSDFEQLFISSNATDLYVLADFMRMIIHENNQQPWIRGIFAAHTRLQRNTKQLCERFAVEHPTLDRLALLAYSDAFPGGGAAAAGCYQFEY